MFWVVSVIYFKNVYQSWNNFITFRQKRHFADNMVKMHFRELSFMYFNLNLTDWLIDNEFIVNSVTDIYLHKPSVIKLHHVSPYLLPCL